MNISLVRILAATGVLAASAPAVAQTPAAGIPVLVADGRGFGHGVGMAQDGALWMGRSGASTGAILGQFYPGTAISRSGGEVRVAVTSVPSQEVVLAFPGGGEVRDALSGPQSAGFPIAVAAGGQVRLRADSAGYTAEVLPGGGVRSSAAGPGSGSVGRSAQVDPGTTTTSDALPAVTTTSTPEQPTTSTTAEPAPASTSTTEAPPTTTTPAGSSPARSARTLWAVPSGGATISVPARSRRYRGVLEATAAAGPLRLVNQVDVETYLRGMGEVRDPSWPAASLRAQAIASRTYALRAQQASGEICDDQRCQVYLGAQAEYAAMDKAVADTRGQVLAYRGGFVAAVFSANGGGASASRLEGFGVADDGAYPYLRPAPYPTKDPLPWSVPVALTDVAARVGYPGQIESVTTARSGPSGRVLEVAIAGTAGARAIPGIAFQRALGLRSTLFALRVDNAAAAPPPPPPALDDPGVGLQQLLPEEIRPLPIPATTPPTLTSLPEGQALPVGPIAGPDGRRSPWGAAAALLLAMFVFGLPPAAIARRAGASGRAWLPRR